MTGSDQELFRFIRSSFSSVWALELLLVIKREPRPWTPAELVSTMRSSELVVTRAIDSIVAAGLASIDAGGVRYQPVNGQVAEDVERTEKLYAARPDAVRRTIVSKSVGDLKTFADAFRWRSD